MTLTVFAAFAARLADWQLLHGEEYREMAQNAGSITESSERIRGEILDKDGNGLVVNETRCRLTVDRTKIDNSASEKNGRTNCQRIAKMKRRSVSVTD